ncbi:MAG: NAD(P)H-hydrate dehydratase [Actinobacteria bacterium]|nr:NAD(P)H-hydrate dehydratase [Actinomycetota bacterium]MBI3686795.1 NAD(P)H-hydrate dehydratase [Actinomycetota bacterium]
MIGAWPVAEVRAAEEALMARLPDGALMHRAAHGLAVACRRLLGRSYGARVVLLVGAGNNGGDALYAGARLARGGAQVTAILLSPERAHAGGLAALRGARGRVLAGTDAAEAAAVLAGADLVLDGIVGIGGSGGLRPRAAELVEETLGSGALRVAVDVPSGVDSDTGAVPGAVFPAEVTVTFGCHKPGLLVGAGAVAAGRVELVDIGLGAYLPRPRLEVVEPADVAAGLRRPTARDDKYTRGVVGVAAGSSRFTGAALLAVGAAVRGPAGMVRYVGPVADLVRSHYPEVVVSEGRPTDAGRVQSWVVGPGMGTDEAAREVLHDVLGTDLPVLVDADGLTLLAADPGRLAGRRAPTVLTPHDREFARLAGFVPGPDRLAAARRAAGTLGCVVLLKGDRTIVARPDGRAFVDRAGTPWLATAGSGDVLSGLTGALLASGAAGAGAGVAGGSVRAPAFDPARLAASGVALHGRAGRIAARYGVPSAAGVLAAVPESFATVGLADGRP